jgi:hypothetical protein
MLGAQAVRLAGRVQRVGEQQQAVNELGRTGGEHRCLSPAIGLSAEIDRA